MPADWQPYAGGAEPSYAGEKPNLPFACLHWGAFALPFPLSLLFFPLGWIEWYIRWAVTSSAAIA